MWEWKWVLWDFWVECMFNVYRKNELIYWWWIVENYVFKNGFDVIEISIVKVSLCYEGGIYDVGMKMEIEGVIFFGLFVCVEKKGNINNREKCLF